MLIKILVVLVLFAGAVVSIIDPQFAEKTKHYRRDPHIARALRRHHHGHGSHRRHYHARLSDAHYQQGENVEQHERHANHNRPGRDYANNIDEYYGGCPAGFTGLLSYPYDCRRFVNCWKGRAYIQTCGPGTVFNGETLECDNPTKVVCQGLGGVTKTNPEPHGNRLARVQTDSAADEPSCPPGFTGLLPHPHDCSKFLNCASGTMHIQMCGPQTMFDPRMKVCDFAHKVDCAGRESGSYSSPSPPASGNRGGKTFEINSRDNNGVNHEVPQRKGWSHSHSHHHHGYHYGQPSRQGPTGSFSHHNHNCTEAHHHDPPSAPPAAQTPLIYRDRWANMNRTRPSVSVGRPTSEGSWTRTTLTRQQPGRWTTPIPETRTTPKPTWQSHGTSGNSWTRTTTVSPPSNYPNIYYDNRPDRTNTDTDTQTTTTNIYYAQPVDDDQPSEEVFSNVYGADVSEITLPSKRRNASRGVYFPSVTNSNQPAPSHPSMDAIDIPNVNLMPPYPSSPSDDRQSQIPEQYPDFSSPYPSYTVPQSQKPLSRPTTTVFLSSSPDDGRTSVDAINIPSMNLMPPHRTDNRQPPEPPSPYPSYPAPQPPRAPQSGSRTITFNRTTVFSPQGHPTDTIIIPNMNLMPPHRDVPGSVPDDGQSQASGSSRFNTNTVSINSSPVPEQELSWTRNDESNLFGGMLPPLPAPPQLPDEIEYPDVPDENQYTHNQFGGSGRLPTPPPPSEISEVEYTDLTDENSHFGGNFPPLPPPPEIPDEIEYTPPLPPPTSTRPPRPSYPRFNTTTVVNPTPRIPDPQPNWIPSDESNLFGGMLPPLPSVPQPPEESEYTPPPRPNHSSRLPYPYVNSTTPLPGVKTNVRVFQVYPPPAIQNATTRLHPSPFYSPSYSGVAHSRNTTWSSRPPIKTSILNASTSSARSSTTTSVPRDNYEPEIIFSHEAGVVLPRTVNHMVSSTTTERHGVLPPNYNHGFYKQTTPTSVYRAPEETNTNDDIGQAPLSEAIRLLLRPYFNRSGTVTDDMAAKAESHIMSLARSKEPTSTSTSTSTSTTTATSTIAPEIPKDVEIYFAGEQNSLTPENAHPTHSYVHPPSKYHQHQHHNRDFHRTHPHLPNPYENELGGGDQELTTPRTWQLVTPTPTVQDSAVDDVCQFDCGNGKCVKAFETCDGINHCGNRKDEESCDHLGYEIRLSNGDSGRVEVKILGQWGYVCDDKFGIQDANVVCRELGFPLGASEVHGNSFYPPVDAKKVSFAMDEVDCIGNEAALKDCPFMGWGVSDCGPDEVVGIQCKTPVMKCPNDYWLCSTSKECIPPAFVCDNVPDCSDQSDESSGVCNSTVEYRLKGGRGKQEGRLEVLYHGAWGTICDDDFGQSEAQVACNSLGYYGPAKIVKNAFGPGSGPIWLDQVSCFGNESSLDTCNHWSWGEHNCNHTEDVSLKCTPGSPPRSTNRGVKGSPKPADDVQTTTMDDIGMDLYPMERSSKFSNSRKVCGHFNPNLTEELPLELERVVKGNIAKRGHHPWQATIRTKGQGGISSHWCGAVLISKKHLLTAAHCLVGYSKGAYFIRLGDHYANIAESSEIDSYIENWYIHEKFRDGTHMNNDIAVIVMKNPVRFNDYIQPICLPPEGTEYKEGRQCTISGWGSIQSGVSTPANNLRVAQIPIISDEICKLPHVYGNSITEGMFCAGFLEEGVDACEGDSGGPFVCSDSDTETLYGIISWGQQCGHANKPGVYVKIEKYLDWIYEKIRFSMQQTK